MQIYSSLCSKHMQREEHETETLNTQHFVEDFFFIISTSYFFYHLKRGNKMSVSKCVCLVMVSHALIFSAWCVTEERR